jgi:hypothetical protein
MEAPSAEWMNKVFLRVERWVGRTLFAAPFLEGDRRMLFVLGHMRTGSSLLVHILASHRNIMGYGETHNVYTGPEDFGATAANVYRHMRAIPGGEAYLLDKVLHEHHILHSDVLEHSSVRVLFMIRRPDTALSSMVRNVRNDVVSGAEEAYRHYVQQMEWIHQLSQGLPAEQWTHTTYSELMQKSDAVLARIASFLELSAPLSKHYETNRYTGTPGIGDPGPHIEAGCIKRDIDRDVEPRVRPYVERAQERFETCRQLLQGKGR